MNIVLVPCFLFGARAFNADYTGHATLLGCAANSFKSAVSHVDSADQVRMLHSPIESGDFQDFERRLIREVLRLSAEGHNVLMLEADTLCLSLVDIFKWNSRRIELFAFTGHADYPEFPDAAYLNSGVVYVPAKLGAAQVELLESSLASDWPKSWAMSQLLWNRVYYSQFSTVDEGAAQVAERGNGKFNWLVDQPVAQVSAQEARISHFFTSRGTKRVLKLQNTAAKRGLPAAVNLYRRARLRDRALAKFRSHMPRAAKNEP